MQPIQPNDPRLRGLPKYKTMRRTKKGFEIFITAGPRGKTKQVFRQLIDAKDYGNNIMAVTEQAARELLFLENERRGLIANKCYLTVEGNIEMDIGRGYKMQFSPKHLDVVRQYRWCPHIAKYAKHLIYAVARVNGKSTQCHRLITGATKDVYVDHLDGNGLNNTEQNLALTNAQGNAQNRKFDVKNTTGVTGVNLRRNRKGFIIGYGVHWPENGKQRFKVFSFARYGMDDALDAAISWRDKMEVKWNIYSRRRISGQSTIKQTTEDNAGSVEETVVGTLKRKLPDSGIDEPTNQKKQRTIEELFPS
jgi:hypothetical protein